MQILAKAVAILVLLIMGALTFHALNRLIGGLLL
jgi:hypothetical protein